MNANEFRELLRKFNACVSGLDGTSGLGYPEVWNTCKRPDWMLWLADKMIGTPEWPTRQEIADTALRIADTMSQDSESCRLHAEQYAIGANTTPMILDHDLVASGYFGDLTRQADMVRDLLKVPR